MKLTTLIVCFSLTAPAVVAQSRFVPAKALTATGAKQTRSPYLLTLKKVDETQAGKLTKALRGLPGVAKVEAVAGEGHKLQIHTTSGHYVSQTQVQSILNAQKLKLDSFAMPQWARVRLYVVEASGGA